MGRSLFLAVTLVAAPASATAQGAARRLPTAETTTVLVDVVVRDGKGRPVTDLTAGDFEVLENGARQVVERFVPPATPAPRPVEAPPQKAGPETAAAATPDPVPGDRGTTIAFVFDRLSTEGRVAAQRAVRAALADRRLRDVAGVFAIEHTLVVLEDFTDDGERLLAAVEALSGRVVQSGPTALDAAREATGRRLAANAAAATLVGMPPPPGTSPVAYVKAVIDAKQISMARAIADAFERLARDEAGQATAHALTAIVDVLRRVPGRKSVVLFSEGLFRTEANEQRFRSVVHSANRSSVSIYAVEATGLQTHSYESLTQRELRSTADLSLARQAAGADGGGGAFTRELEAIEDAVRFHPRSSLQWIADATGGVFVRDTNDLEGALRRIDSDARSYYLLGYTPANRTFDGAFRKIAVRVARRGLEVKARSGYFAVRSQGPVLAHVAPALALLEAEKRPRDVEVHAGAWSFPAGEAASRVSLAVSVPAEAVSRLARAAKGRFDVTLLARLRDADGRPVEAVSRRFLVDAAKPGDLLLLRDAWLPSGSYTLEAVAYESASARAGVVTRGLDVPDGGQEIDRLQLLLVRGAVPAREAPVDLETDHPLRYGDVVLQPLTGEPLARDPSRPLVFELVAASPSGLAGVEGAVEVFRGERSLTWAAVRWGAPEPSGLVRHVAAVEVAALEPGPYELRVTLTQGDKRRVLRAPFELAGPGRPTPR